MERSHVGAVAGETGLLHNISRAIENGLQELRVVIGIVFQVGILNDDELPCCVQKTRPQGCTFALVSFVIKHFEVLPLKLAQ